MFFVKRYKLLIMEVLLRRTKITASIVKQMMHIHRTDMDIKNVLGWVLVKEGKKFFRKIIFYDAGKQTIKCSYMPKSCILRQETNPDVNLMSITLDHGSINYGKSDNENAEDFKTCFRMIEKCRDRAIELGQIFY